MSPPDAIDQLLPLAHRDLKAASILAHAGEPQMDAAGFHLQQAAEKGLKAWLKICKCDYPRTHDLSLLLGLIEDQGQEIADFWPLVGLNPFAVQFRYELPGEDLPDFESFAKLIRTLLDHVQALPGNSGESLTDPKA